MPLSRRSLIAASLSAAGALAAAACDGDRSLRIAAAPVGPDGQQFALPRIQPTALTLPPEPVAQGGVVPVGLSGARITAATVEFAGRTYHAVPDGEDWLAYVATGQPVGSAEQVAPGDYALRVRYERGSDPRGDTLAGMVTVSPTDYPVEYITLPPSAASLLGDVRLAQEDAALLGEAYATLSAQRAWEGPFRRPSPAAITDPYGTRRSYNGGPVGGSHAGVDFGAFSGDPIVAAAPGRVVIARALPIRGNVVVIDHGAGVHTGYCHLLNFAVSAGDTVAAGERIGACGSTGLSTGAHLHWEVAVGGMQVDGLRWLGT